MPGVGDLLLMNPAEYKHPGLLNSSSRSQLIKSMMDAGERAVVEKGAVWHRDVGTHRQEGKARGPAPQLGVRGPWPTPEVPAPAANLI
jgi:hypothetical protein